MSRQVGFIAEDAAQAFLEQRSYKIIGRNIVYPFGELDIVAWDKQELVFVEVKYRRNPDPWALVNAITKTKQKRLILAAEAYLQTLSKTPHCRFDVLCMSGLPPVFSFEHIIDALSS